MLFCFGLRVQKKATAPVMCAYPCCLCFVQPVLAQTVTRACCFCFALHVRNRRRHRLTIDGLSLTNENDSIGPVRYEAWSSPNQWVLPFKLKKQVFGDKGRISVGGVIEGLENIDESSIKRPSGVPEDTLPGMKGFQVHPGRGGQGVHEKRDEDNEEIVFFHAWPTDLYAELIHSLAADAVLDLTAGPGHCAKAALQARVPYVGVTLTEAHQRMLQTHLQKFVWKGLRDSESQTMYNAEVATVVNKIAVAKPKTDAKPKSNPKPKVTKTVAAPAARNEKKEDTPDSEESEVLE